MKLIRTHWQLFTILIVVFALWETTLVVPLRILTVFLHELSHAVAAWLTGGTVLEISVTASEGGHAVTRGGNIFAILSAGYLGSLGFGVAMLLAAMRGTADRAVLGFFGLVMLLVTALYVRDSFALVFCSLAGLSLIAIALLWGSAASDWVLRVIGLVSLVYVPFDIFDDTIARTDLPSDARLLAEHVGGPALLWGVIWLVVSLAVILWCLRHALSLPARPGRIRK